MLIQIVTIFRFLLGNNKLWTGNRKNSCLFKTIFEGLTIYTTSEAEPSSGLSHCLTLPWQQPGGPLHGLDNGFTPLDVLCNLGMEGGVLPSILFPAGQGVGLDDPWGPFQLYDSMICISSLYHQFFFQSFQNFCPLFLLRFKLPSNPNLHCQGYTVSC